MSRHFFTLLIGIGLLIVRVSVEAADDELLKKLQDAVNAVQQREGIQGVSASVVYGDQQYTVCAGESHPGASITPDMVFGIGSNTKTLTSVVLLRLQEQGRCSLDDRVSLYIPPHPHIDSTITIRQLLNHTSGLGEYAGGPTYRDSILADPRRVWTSNELLAMIPSAQFEPGRSWQYCNSNYLVAGIIAEQVGGKALHTLMQQEIFDVISMDSTRLFPQHDFVGELAHRWMGGRDASALPMNSEWSGAWAAGAVISSASELAQFYRSMFNKVLLSDRSVSELTTFIGPNSYGLGISEQRIGGQVVTGHTGEIRGYTSTAMWVPALSAVVVVLTNELPGKPIAVADTIIRVLSSHVSSVDDDHSLTMSDLFTAKLFDASGNCILDVQDRSALQHINAGMYLLRSSVSQYAAVVILPGGEVALCTRSTAARP